MNQIEAAKPTTASPWLISVILLSPAASRVDGATFPRGLSQALVGRPPTGHDHLPVVALVN